jgi:hypothetical protein
MAFAADIEDLFSRWLIMVSSKAVKRADGIPLSGSAPGLGRRWVSPTNELVL